MTLSDFAKEVGLQTGQMLRWAQGRVKTNFPAAIDRFADGTRSYDPNELRAWFDQSTEAQLAAAAARHGLEEEAFIKRLLTLLSLAELAPAEYRRLLQAAGIEKKA